MCAVESVSVEFYLSVLPSSYPYLIYYIFPYFSASILHPSRYISCIGVARTDSAAPTAPSESAESRNPTGGEVVKKVSK